MKKKLKVSFRTFGKIGFLLVVIGFFFPISSIGIGRLQLNGGNGFELAKALMDRQTVSAILVYVVFAAAVAGVLVGVLLLLRNKIKVYVDWVCLLACIGSGLIVYLPRLDDAIKPNLQTGGYLILAGWIIALAAQVISLANKERS